jgi:hypothetical protein
MAGLVAIGAKIGRLNVAIRVMAGLVPAIHVVTRLVVFRTRTLSFAADAALF